MRLLGGPRALAFSCIWSFDTFDPACSLAFGEPCKSGWHLSQFDYACEIDFAASIAHSAQLGMDVALPRITWTLYRTMRLAGTASG